jgi:hydroxylamine dehydrogenase
MKTLIALFAIAFASACNAPPPTAGSTPPPPPTPTTEGKVCVDCHKKVTPGAVGDWQISAHAQNDVDCATCHGTDHGSAEDVDKIPPMTLDKCGECHEDRVTEFKSGKHALAWAAMNAMPTAHWQPMEMTSGMKGCGGCHKLGIKSEEEVAALKKQGVDFGYASCDACHTRHTFSAAEARDPRACATCHMGFDHPQWEMYSTSKHGIRHALKRDGILPESASAPTCQTCHMPGGNHDVHTAWGFLAVRTDGLAPYPGEDAEWWADRVTILQALGVLAPAGTPTARLQVVADAKVANLTAAGFDKQRNKMIEVCSECHSRKFAVGELGKGDRMIRETDRLLAEAIRIISSLYKDGVLAQPEEYAYAFPDLLAFHDSPTPIENRLFLMHLKHRMRAFQGTFHANPDYALWYGWNEMQLDLTEIKAQAKELRRIHVKEK